MGRGSVLRRLRNVLTLALIASGLGAFSCTDSYSPFWSGYVALLGEGYVAPYVTVWGFYQQPGFGFAQGQEPEGCSPNAAAAWVGLGGYYGDSLLQAGTVLDSQANPSLRAFYETIDANSSNNPSPVFFDLSLSPADRIFASVHYDTTAGQMHLIVHDLRSGDKIDLFVSTESRFYSGNSAEWIGGDRKYTGPGAATPVPLTNFGQVPWDSLGTSNASGADLASANYASVGLWNGTSHSIPAIPTPPPLAIPISLGPDSFVDKWAHC
jgi:hypothetical protein